MNVLRQRISSVGGSPVLRPLATTPIVSLAQSTWTNQFVNTYVGTSGRASFASAGVRKLTSLVPLFNDCWEHGSKKPKLDDTESLD